MKVVDPCYEKLVKEFIVKITSECVVEGNKEYIKVCDRGKCVKFSPQTLMTIWAETSLQGIIRFPLLTRMLER